MTHYPIAQPQNQSTAMDEVRKLYLFARRNARLVGGVALAGMALAFVLAMTLPARFSSEALIMLDPRKTNATNMEAVLSSMPSESPAIRSEIDIMRSRSVIDRVIDQLNLLDDPHFNNGLSATNRFFDLFSRDTPQTREIKKIATRDNIARKLLSGLDVSNDGRSYSIAIVYHSTNPAQSAELANAFADQYLADQYEVKLELARRIDEWLSRRMDDLRGKVKIAEEAVEKFKNDHNLVEVGDETLTEQQLGDINAQLIEARASLSQTQARLQSVQGVTGSRLESAPIVIASPLIQQLKQQEAEVRRKEADLSTRYGDRHPLMIDARNELRSIEDKIGEEVAKTIAGVRNDNDIAQSKVDSLEDQLTKLKAEAGQGNQDMVTLRQLQREAAADRSLYESFLNRFKEVAAQQDLQISDSRIIARATLPVTPYFPNFKMFLALGAVLGGILGLVIALVLEHLDRGLRSLSTAEQIYGISPLGITPIADVAPGQLVTDYILEKPLSVYAESIRSIRASIHFSNVDNPPKVIAVTSSFPNEGKTIFSISLARLMAASGHKVMLIDADLRRPRVYSTLSLDKTKPGLAAVLAGEATLAEAIQKDASGADVLISYAKAPNPQDLLNSHQMEKLLASLREKYEMIVIDTPPIMAVADAALIGQKADTTVYVARWASTPREVIGEGLKQMAKFNVRMAGMVLSQVDLTDHKQYGFDDYSHYYGQYKAYYAN
ncbi:MAG: polysaccharide biosynthesis tyrosine autokinase [Alphaproteobacteria bacterium]|nr:polysaccharide biosynthesis tyrosine autokinase [Alphaproteobacteria bacterium]